MTWWQWLLILAAVVLSGYVALIAWLLLTARYHAFHRASPTLDGQALVPVRIPGSGLRSR